MTLNSGRGEDELAGPVLIVPNVYEFNRRSLDTRDPVSHSRLFSQIPFVLFGLAHKAAITVLHKPINPELLAHWQDRLAYQPRLVLCATGSGRLCEDAARDSECLSELAQWSFRELVPWGPTRECANLQHLLGAGVGLTDTWPLVGILDGKAANRGLILAAAEGGGSIMVHPAAVLSRNLGAAAQVRRLVHAWQSAVVKPGLTWGGKGTFQVDAGGAEEARLEGLIEGESGDSGSNYWIVEPLIGSPGRNISPSFDWTPDASADGGGRARAGRMVMDGFRCTGTIYGKGALAEAEPFRGEMTEFVQRTAGILQELGYAGWFDVDFLVNGADAYVTESNVRHTGGTVPICVADHLLGADWEADRTVVTLDALGTSFPHPSMILEVATPIVRAKLGSDAALILTAFDDDHANDAVVSIWLAGGEHDTTLDCAMEIKGLLTHL